MKSSFSRARSATLRPSAHASTLSEISPYGEDTVLVGELWTTSLKKYFNSALETVGLSLVFISMVAEVRAELYLTIG